MQVSNRKTLQQNKRECVFTTSLQQGKQHRNGGCRACYYSHSIVADLQSPIDKGLQARK